MPIQMSSLSYSNEFHELLNDLPCRLQYISDWSPELQIYQDVSGCTYMKFPFPSFRNTSCQQQHLFPYRHLLSHLWLAHWLDLIKVKILNKENNTKNYFSHLPHLLMHEWKLTFKKNKTNQQLEKELIYQEIFQKKIIKLIAIHISLSSIIMIIFICRLMILINIRKQNSLKCYCLT